MKNYVMIAMIFFIAGANAQVMDDFSDGNFTADPSWTGTASQFTVNTAQQLQLNNTLAGISWLSTACTLSSFENVEWQTSVRQSFAPSGSNYGMLYLASDQSDLTLPLHGYYLQFGEAGSADAITLCRQDGLLSVVVCKGKAGGVSASFNVRVRIIFRAGQWRLSTDYAGGTNFVDDAVGSDATYSTGRFTGVRCVYTSSNASKFFYDDFLVRPFQADHMPPVATSVTATSSHDAEVTFSEKVTHSSAEAKTNYTLDHPFGNPQAAALQSDGSTVKISFSKIFESGVQNTLTISGVSDTVNNVMQSQELSFSFIQPVVAASKDIVITEIFADPSPSIGLPAAEYIEIFNRSASALDLTGWMITDGSAAGGAVGKISSAIVMPGAYKVITASSALPLFSSYANTIAVDGFPSLNNDGDNVIVKSAEGKTIDSVKFSLQFYHDRDKQDGGWSMEIIDINNPCGEEDNWTASENSNGGTPGIVNAVNASKPDVTGPRLIDVVTTAMNVIVLTFDEKLDIKTCADGFFTVTPDISFEALSFLDRSLRQIEIRLAGELASNQLYTLSLDRIYDCNGNGLQQQYATFSFALPATADSLDVVINEILFNPRPLGVDFVEVYNASAKFINLKNWTVANYEAGILKNQIALSERDFVIGPKRLLCLTADTSILKTQYPSGNHQRFFLCRLPGFSDDEGSVALVNESRHIIDYLLYDKGFHSPLVKNDEGVSLERIVTTAPTNDPENWRSASAQSGFATPGNVNSSARSDDGLNISNVVVTPAAFAPGSGVNDFAKISYRFDGPGKVANVKIVDQQGRVIRTISNNQTLGTEGFFRWDGDRDDGAKARIGYYLVWMEVFDLEGDVKTFRKGVVVSGR